MTSTQLGAAAAIDLGTETALLVIGRPLDNGDVEVLEDHCLATRLGAGLAHAELLEPRAVERTLDVLDTFARRIELAGIAADRVAAVGTAVLRRAADAGAFVETVRSRCGIELTVIAPEREAALAHAAVVADGAGPDAIMVDVGGGSSEVVTEAGATRHSIDLGAVLATDRWLGGAERALAIDPASWSEFSAAVEREVSSLPAGWAGGREVVLLGGTASNLACLGRDLETYDPRLAEGWTVEAPLARTWADRLAQMDFEERMDLPIEPGRAGILPAGLGILAAVLDRLGADGGRVSGRGLRYGLLRELLSIAS